jgi:hypothetical protein
MSVAVSFKWEFWLYDEVNKQKFIKKTRNSWLDNPPLPICGFRRHV